MPFCNNRQQRLTAQQQRTTSMRQVIIRDPTPSQGRDIAAVLGAGTRADGCLRGQGVVVTWCFGHLLEMVPPEGYGAELKRWSLDALPIIPTDWKVEVKRSGAKQLGVIRKLLKEATSVVVATDADREGETIGREVLELCNYRGSVQRLWLSALDAASIRAALADLRPGSATEALYAAGLGRARADWLVGMNLTRAYTLLGRAQGVEGVLSVGRVQTPALALVVARDRLIEGFKPKPYWVLDAFLDAGAGRTFRTSWQPVPPHADEDGRCVHETAAVSLAQQLPGKRGVVDVAVNERKAEVAPLPYDLSTLQLDADRRLGLDGEQTLGIVQALYETHKAATYPRTDCAYLPSAQLAEAHEVLAAAAASDPAFAPLAQQADLARVSRAWNDKKITAHHAIIPTKARIDTSALSETERAVYDLIRRRYLAQFLADHEYDQARIEVLFGPHRFVATGRVPVVSGWRAVFSPPEETEATSEEEGAGGLPRLRKGDEVNCIRAEVAAKQTKPPSRFTGGTLIQAMKTVGRTIEDPALKKILRDNSGIGTEATRASIIKTLQDRDYLKRAGKKNLISTPKARALIDALPAPVKDPSTTALWEQALEDIAAGRAQLAPFLASQAEWIRKLVDLARRSTPEGLRTAAPASTETSGRQCPSCGKPMRKIKGRKGSFWGCTGYPDCKATAPEAKARSVKTRGK